MLVGACAWVAVDDGIAFRHRRVHRLHDLQTVLAIFLLHRQQAELTDLSA